MNTIPPIGLYSKVSVLAYLCLCLNVLLFSSLIAAAPDTFRALNREDHLVEYITVVWVLLSGFLLFVTAWMEPSLFRRCAYILGGMAMVFFAGEEISWGQRIFGFATPDFLMPLNQQGEFTAHNIANGTFDIIHLNSALILCMATSAALFCRKDRLFGIPLPSIPLMLGFLIMISYDSGTGIRDESITNFREYIMGVRRSFGFILVEEKGLLLLFLIYSLFSGKAKLIIASAATLSLVFALSYVNYHSGVDRGSLFEAREYLLGICCLFYSLELLLAQRRLAAISPRVFRLAAPKLAIPLGRLAAISPSPFSGMNLPGGRIPFWLTTCSLVIAGSIGLMFFEHYTRQSEEMTAYDYLMDLVGDSQPSIRSDFDVYLIENTLVYVKEPCARADTEAMFFLALFPVDVNDLTNHRKQYGFDNLDFRFYEDGVRSDGRCMTAEALPYYDIIMTSPAS